MLVLKNLHVVSLINQSPVVERVAYNNSTMIVLLALTHLFIAIFMEIVQIICKYLIITLRPE
jgi:hypothetical protein